MTINNKPYIIAETAFHHEGNISFLNALVDEMCKSQADAIKFHLLFDLEDYIISSHPAKKVLEGISIPEENWKSIIQRVNSGKKDAILLCNDIQSLKWVNENQHELNVRAIELHSTGLNDIFLLNEAARFEKTVILGVGGSTLDEVKYAVDFLRENGKNDILLMHGFQNYPTNYKEINFKRMLALKEIFDLPVGYADHTDPADEKNAFISVLPQVLGFNILEKHVTNVFGEKRIDAQAAVSFETMETIISLAQDVFSTRGTESFAFSESEKKYGNTGPMKKAIVARKKINQGEIIRVEDIAFKRTEASSPIQQSELKKIIGCKATSDIQEDEIISYSNIEYTFEKNDFNQFFVSNK